MLEIRRLTKRYGPVTALDDASFTARRGRLVGFLGPNGAGKTTTMRCVFGLATPGSRRRALGRRRGRREDAPALRLHARAARPVPPDARGGAARVLRPAPRAQRARRTHPQRCLAGAVRAGGPGQVQARGPVARQPAARAARRGAGPRPGAPGPRRAVLGPRPHRHRHHVRGPPRAGGGRRGRGLQLAPAGPRRGGVRGRRDHQPRPGRGRGRHRRAQGRSPGGGTSRSRSPGRAGPGWTASTAWTGTRSSSAAATGSSSSWTRARTSTGCLPRRRRRARCAGSATSHRGSRSCSWRRSRHPSRPPRRARGEPLAGRPARGHARDPGARPEPRLRAVAGVHPAPPGGRVRAAPAAPRRPGDPARAGGAGAGRASRRRSRRAPRPTTWTSTSPPSPIGRRRWPRSRRGPSTPPWPSPPTCRRRAS